MKLDHRARGEMLAAYVLPRPGCVLHDGQLRSELEKTLPAYMLPSAICVIDHVPLTPSGKLDRNRLPDPISEPTMPASEAPLPGIEQTLAELWQDVLQIKSIGRHDNFFHLGGHSLLAARLVSRAAKEFKKKLSLASLVQAPTIARLALILQGSSLPINNVIKEGNPKGTQLLWIGAEPWLPRLAKSLDDSTALQALTLDPASIGAFGPEFRIQDMAAYLASRICEIQPNGPYFLGGFCLHALLAYEIAQQLRSIGHDIGLLILGDIFAPAGEQRHSTGEAVRNRLRTELREFRQMLNSESREWSAYARRRFEAFQEIVEYRRWQGGTRPKEMPQTLLQALCVAGQRYEPHPFQGKVLFLQAKEERDSHNQSTFASWKALIVAPEVFEYPGWHMDLFEEASFRLAAETIESSICIALTKPHAAFAPCGNNSYVSSPASTPL